ncbi:hypothetical protein [Kibdelosporangium phytohabitans]|nr:hypothetical protein [Kibdelosporangium phytohabitans]MBE1467400.1 hypothetical protein [Kibdelosporangium phytohabitans]
MDMHQAYLTLRTYARTHHRRLSDVARDVAINTVEAGVLLSDPATTSQP